MLAPQFALLIWNEFMLHNFIHCFIACTTFWYDFISRVIPFQWFFIVVVVVFPFIPHLHNSRETVFSYFYAMHNTFIIRLKFFILSCSSVNKFISFHHMHKIAWLTCVSLCVKQSMCDYLVWRIWKEPRRQKQRENSQMENYNKATFIFLSSVWLAMSCHSAFAYEIYSICTEIFQRSHNRPTKKKKIKIIIAEQRQEWQWAEINKFGFMGVPMCVGSCQQQNIKWKRFKVSPEPWIIIY